MHVDNDEPYRLVGLVVKASAPGAADLILIPAFAVHRFPGRVKAVPYNNNNDFISIALFHVNMLNCAEQCQ